MQLEALKADGRERTRGKKGELRPAVQQRAASNHDGGGYNEHALDPRIRIPANPEWSSATTEPRKCRLIAPGGTRPPELRSCHAVPISASLSGWELALKTLVEVQIATNASSDF